MDKFYWNWNFGTVMTNDVTWNIFEMYFQKISQLENYTKIF